MKTLRDSVYLIVALGSIAMAAWQPSEAGDDRQVAQSARPAQKVALDLGKHLQSAGQSSVVSAR